MDGLFKELIAGVALVISATVGGVFAYLASRSRQVREAEEEVEIVERELSFKRDALGLPEFIDEWESIKESVLNLIETTSVDRWLMLRAWNGKHDPRWTTAVYQIRAKNQVPVPYISYEMDYDYKERLLDVMSQRKQYIDVAGLPECDLKNIYQNEGVHKSYWTHVCNLKLHDSDSRAVIYCSFATHEDVDITEGEKFKCDLLISRLRGLAVAMHAGVGYIDIDEE